MLLKSALLNIAFVTYVAAQSFPLGPFPPNGDRPSIDSEKAAENGYQIPRPTRCDRRSDSDSDSSDDRDHHRHSSSRCHSSSHHSSSHCRTSSHCRSSSSHCHSTTRCHTSSHCEPTRSKCCTKTVTTSIDNKCCYLLIHPCPTNSSVTVTSTVSVLPTQASVLPTQASVLPTQAAVALVCTPCTNYVTTTTMPSLACTTMIFCDVAGQSENCIAKNEQDIEDIVSKAARDGAQVFVNGQLVVFRSGSSSASVSASSGSTVLTVTGQQANDASAAVVGSGLVGLFGAIAGFLLFGI